MALGNRKPGPGIVAALDVGTAQNSCLIARIDGQGNARILGHATQASSGMRNAAVVDIDKASHAIGSVVQAAEDKSKQKVDRVLVNVSAGQIMSERVQSSVMLGDGPIGSPAVQQAIAQSRDRAPQDGRTLLHFLPLSYAVDGMGGIRDPRGLFGRTLDLETVLITAQTGVLRTLRTAIGRAHLDADEAIASAYAAGLAVLHPDERDLGVTLIDMGAGSTGVAVFSEGQPVFCGAVPIGGAHITSDIARGLSTPVAYAERLKILQGSCLPSASDERDELPVEPISAGFDEPATPPTRALLVRIIRARIEEIFEYVQRITAPASIGRLGGGAVVLTGGGAQLHGVSDLAGQILDKRTRIGRPGGVAGLGDLAESPAFATSVGMVAYAQQRLTGGLGSAMLDLGKSPGVIERLGALLKIRR